MKSEDNEEEGLLQLQESVDSDPTNASHHYNLALFIWEKKQQEEEKAKAVEHLVISAKLNPNNGSAFRLLGHYYSKFSIKDTSRASKCYQRSLTLNPDDFEAGHAIRGYPTCADLWETLGLAYQRLGMLTATIKSYGRAIELEDTKVFSLVESGNILLMLGSFRKVSAHCGLASGMLGLAKECVNSGAFAWGASLLQEASDIAKASIGLFGNASCTWKLHGDIQLTFAKCFPWMDGKMCIEYYEVAFRKSISSWKKSLYLAAVSASRSYQRALHLTPWKANIYADIAISMDLIRSLEERNEPKPVAWQLPEKMSVGALFLEGDSSDFWVIFGCLSTHSPMKQHALIRGLQLDASLATAWAYLGKLYRKVGEKQLTAQSFDHARSIDPALALPRAGISTEFGSGGCTLDEAYESCLRAVQILPAGNAIDSSRECEGLKKEGLLDTRGLHIHALSLWKLGKNELALSVVRILAASISKMDNDTASASICLVCKLMYHISGLESASSSILKMPRELLKSSSISFIIFVIHVLDHSNRLESVIPISRESLTSDEEIAEMHSLIALGKVVKAGLEQIMSIQKGVHHLRKALHKYPHSSLLRNQLGSLLLSSKEWNDVHTVPRCTVVDSLGFHVIDGLGSAPEILGAAAVSCNSSKTTNGKLSFATCIDPCMHGRQAISQLQSLQSGAQNDCIGHALDSLRLTLPDSTRFFAHLVLCRAYAALEDFPKSQIEYMKCVELKTEHPIGLISLKLLESRFNLHTDMSTVNLKFEECLKENRSSRNMWMAVFQLVLGQSFIWDQDLLHAEEGLAQGCSLVDADSSLFLCHGVICMELAKQQSGSQFLSLSVSSLRRAEEASPIPLPIVSALLAQAEASLGSRGEWERKLRLEWFSWPSDTRPAELYFQMHLLTRQLKGGPDSSLGVGFHRTPQTWILRAIHVNPSCSRYWKLLYKTKV
ncbi:hypothetical protein MKX01_005535 [Papaver californicum]|nr:hypothetical protein MKX01_005535 [Papaver californicum]